MTAPRSIAHVAQPEHSGIPEVVRNLVEHQVRAGCRVTVHAPTTSVLAQQTEPLGARFVAWDASRDPGPSVARESVALARQLAAADPDLVHLHSSKAGLAGRLALRGRRPTVFHPNAWSFVAGSGPVRAVALRWERLGTRWADRVVCASDDERRFAEAEGVRARWAVVPNGVDLSRYAPADADARRAARTALELPDGPLVLLLGRESPQKGTDTMRAAWPAIRAAVPDARLALVGNGFDATGPARSDDGILRAGLQRDVRPWLAAADVVALPSRWEAGLSLAAMEAMATARSVVLADTWGARDGIADGGSVIAIGDAAALAAAVTERLRDPARADEEGRRGRARIEARYDHALVAEQMDGVYADILRERGLG